MAVQPHCRPLDPSDFFADGRVSRPVVPGTVARGQMRTDTVLHTARDDKGTKIRDEKGEETELPFVDYFPFEMDKAALERGKQRFEIYCSVCHGMTGHADGRIVKRGFTPPPNFIKDASRAYKLKDPPKEIPLTEIPVGYFFEVMTKGFGAMADYSAQVPVNDRWAIAAYIRTLQYSQVPGLREKMKEKEKGGKK